MSKAIKTAMKPPGERAYAGKPRLLVRPFRPPHLRSR